MLAERLRELRPSSYDDPYESLSPSPDNCPPWMTYKDFPNPDFSVADDLLANLLAKLDEQTRQNFHRTPDLFEKVEWLSLSTGRDEAAQLLASIAVWEGALRDAAEQAESDIQRGILWEIMFGLRHARHFCEHWVNGPLAEREWSASESDEHEQAYSSDQEADDTWPPDDQ